MIKKRKILIDKVRIFNILETSNLSVNETFNIIENDDRFIL